MPSQLSPCHTARGEKWRSGMWRDRLKKRIEELGLTDIEVARRAGVADSTVRDWLQRVKNAPRIDLVAKVAKAVGLSVSELYEGANRASVLLRVDGILRARGMWASVSKSHQSVVPLTFLDDELVTLDIETNDLEPHYRRGDAICGPKIIGPNVHNFVSMDCIVELSDGRKTVGILMAGTEAGTFTIRPFDVRAEEVRNVCLSWIAPIRMIIRGAK